MIDLEETLSIPAIWTPGMSEEEWQDSVDKMIVRTYATRDFLEGKISFDEFEEVLDFTGIDPIQAHKDWSNGLIYHP